MKTRKKKNPYFIKAITTTEEFIKIKEAWEHFEKKVNHKNITASYAWLITWWEVFKNRNDNEFGYNKQLLILLVYKDNELVAIVPFVHLYRIKYGIKVTFIEFLSQQWGATYIDIVGKNLSKDDIDYIFAWLYSNQKFDSISLKYIPEYSIYQYEHKCYVLSACPYIDMSNYSNYKEYEVATFNKKRRHNFSNALRRAAKNNLEINYSIIPFTEAETEEVIRLSNSKILDDKHDLYLDTGKKEFMFSIARILNTEVMFLTANGMNIAYKLFITFNNTKFNLNKSYDRRYNTYSPGNLLQRESIKHSFSEGVSIDCLGTGVDEFKLRFTQDILKIYTLILRGNTLIGKLIYRKLEQKNIEVENEFLEQLADLSGNTGKANE